MSLAEKTRHDHLNGCPPCTTDEQNQGGSRPHSVIGLLTRSLLCLAPETRQPLLRAFLERWKHATSRNSPSRTPTRKTVKHRHYKLFGACSCVFAKGYSPVLSIHGFSDPSEGTRFTHKEAVVLSYTTKIGKIYFNFGRLPVCST
jgi:hypothetical protein